MYSTTLNHCFLTWYCCCYCCIWLLGLHWEKEKKRKKKEEKIICNYIQALWNVSLILRLLMWMPADGCMRACAVFEKRVQICVCRLTCSSKFARRASADCRPLRGCYASDSSVGWINQLKLLLFLVFGLEDASVGYMCTPISTSNVDGSDSEWVFNYLNPTIKSDSNPAGFKNLYSKLSPD